MSSNFISHRPRITGGSAHASGSRYHTPPGIEGTAVARWIFEQRLNAENAADINRNNNGHTRQQSPIIVISDDDDDNDNQPPQRSLAPSLRSVQTSGTAMKRKILDDEDAESSITVRRPLPSSVVSLRGTSSQARQQNSEVIDLTLSDDDDEDGSSFRPPKRHRNNRWQDKNVPDMSDGVRDELRNEIHGLLGERVTPPFRPPPPVVPIPEVEMDIDEEEEEEVVVEPTPEPVEPKDYFSSLPGEIRNKIYRLLLVSPKPIPVKDLWQEVIVRTSTRRTRGTAATTRTARNRRARVPAMGEEPEPSFSLDPRILRASKLTFQEGAAILYGENTFHYLLRDPGAATISIPGSRRNKRGGNQNTGNRINLKEYGGLIRHVGIELDSNRTGPEYERLMTAALKKLVRTDYEAMGIGYPHDPVIKEIYGPMDVPFHLRTLTVTVSPLFEQVARAVNVADGDGDGPGQGGGVSVMVREPRTLSVVRFFSKNSGVSKALREIKVDFLRVNVHVNSHLAGKASLGDAEGNNEEDSSDSDGEEQEEDEEQVDGNGNKLPKPKQWHLEMTLDLRWVKKHMDKLRKDEPLGDFWENDAIVKAARVKKGSDAERNLMSLRKLLEDACELPELMLKRGKVDGLWQTAVKAETKRLEEKKRKELEFEPDAYDTIDPLRPDVVELKRRLRRRKRDDDDDDEEEEPGSEDDRSEDDSDEEDESDSDEEDDNDDDESDDEEEEIEQDKLPRSRRLKSLVISIDKVGNEWKCFRI
ncbi:hypothetical protein QBC40DRAFT_315406 [Triangularia verruculosa]|uniref:Uncharacterized protein n=1 Tax=Triangularia verruculosa TaxID=2587418 RepID=A0AAN6XN71_9PEZI|nr:hypothetical protein QBC40DRAFT_315406 [Triangularia verruculosa]